MNNTSYGHIVRMDCPVPTGTPAWFYARDSGGEDQDLSVPQQLAVVASYAERHQLLLLDTFKDLARRSTTTEKRVALKQLVHVFEARFPVIEDMKKREKIVSSPLFVLIVWRFNRVSRDLDYRALTRANVAMRGGVILELAGEPTTGNKVVDNFIAMVNDVADLQQIKQNGVDAARGLADIVGLRDTHPDFRQQNPDWPTCDGRYLAISPGRPATGFRGEIVVVGIRERKRKTSTSREMHRVQRWVPDQTDGLWERCRLAWTMRIEGRAIADIHSATHLFKTTGGYTGFFKNRIYTGDYEYGGRIYHGFVPVIVSVEEFEAEQQRIAARAEKLKGRRMAADFEPRHVASRHLLSGLVFCGEVEGEEHPMHADTVTANDHRSQWDFYLCARKKASHSERCTAARVGAQALEETVIDKLMNEVITHANLRPLADDLAQALAERNTVMGTQVAALKGRLDEIQRVIERLLDAIEEDDGGGMASLKDRLKQREAEKAQVNAEIAALKKGMVAKTDIPAISDAQLDDYIALIRNALTGKDTDLAKRLISRLVAKIVIKGETGTVYYTFPFQDLSRDGLLPLRGSLPFPRYFTCSFPLKRVASDSVHKRAPTLERNCAICQRHAQGESLSDLAAAFEISPQRVHQIIQQAHHFNARV